MRVRVLQEDHTKKYHEIEELKGICFTICGRARQLRIDELSPLGEENTSVVDQLVVQTQELQDKVKLLNDAREFLDADKASNSG